MRILPTLLQAVHLPVIVLVAWLYYPYCESGPAMCVWRNVLGVHCPGCGMTRAFCHLVHGQLWEALTWNWAIFPLVAFCAVLSFRADRELLRRWIRIARRVGVRP